MGNDQRVDGIDVLCGQCYVLITEGLIVLMFCVVDVRILCFVFDSDCTQRNGTKHKTTRQTQRNQKFQ